MAAVRAELFWHMHGSGPWMVVAASAAVILSKQTTRTIVEPFRAASKGPVAIVSGEVRWLSVLNFW